MGEGRDQVRIVSDIPGRMRFRLQPGQRVPETMQQISAALGKVEVVGIETNLQTGSVLVHYDPGVTTADQLQAAFASIDLQPVLDLEPSVAPDTRPAGRVMTAAGELNSRVGRATNGVDLRLLVPLGLGALSVRQAFRDTGGLKNAPWYVLAWYSFDSFIKLNSPQRVEGEVP